MQRFELGISPCPNDTFIFYALANGRIDLPFSVDLFMADVEQLNARARKADIAVTKLSVAAMVDALDNYILLRAGGALGYGCGPIMVAKENACVSSLANARIAIPGRMTTANMLLSLHGVHKGERVEMVFDEVMPAVARGDVAAGVVIHEGRFTYAGYGLEKLFDLSASGGKTQPPCPFRSGPLRCVAIWAWKRLWLSKTPSAAVLPLCRPIRKKHAHGSSSTRRKWTTRS